jgi:hypothetical protein
MLNNMYFPPNRIIEVHKQLMYYPIIIPFFSQKAYLMNSEYLISSSSIMLTKSILMIPSNLIYTYMELILEKNVG